MATILVIEDNPMNMKLAALLLHKAGHTVLCAADAESGLALARAAMPDMVLIDVLLFGMDGMAATAMLQQDPVTTRIPVIAVTAQALTSAQKTTRVARLGACVAKPLRCSDLYAAISHLLAMAEKVAALTARAKPSATAG